LRPKARAEVDCEANCSRRLFGCHFGCRVIGAAVVLSKFQAGLRGTGIREASIACHLRHVRAALGWAASIGLIAQAPKVQMPKRVNGSKLMRGRPVTTEEFERMLAAVRSHRPVVGRNRISSLFALVQTEIVAPSSTCGGLRR
jgi:hypothetical protein